MKIVGGGLAGLAAAAKLGATGFEVDLHEARPFLGGRATSFPVNPAEATPRASTTANTCCCVVSTHCSIFTAAAESRTKSASTTASTSFGPGGGVDTLERGPLPTPFHFTGSLLSMKMLGWPTSCH